MLVYPYILRPVNKHKTLESRSKRSADNLNLQLQLGEQESPWIRSYHSNYIANPDDAHSKHKVLASVLFQLLQPKFANMAASDLEPLDTSDSPDAENESLKSQASSTDDPGASPNISMEKTKIFRESELGGLEKKRAADDAQMNIQLDLHVLRDMLRAQAAANRRQLVATDPLEAKSMKKLFGIGKR